MNGRKRSLSALQSEEFEIKDYRRFASEYQELYMDWCQMNEEQQEFDRDIKEKYNNEVLKNKTRGLETSY